MSTATLVGARRKLARDVRPRDTFRDTFGHRFTARNVTLKLSRGIVRIGTEQGVTLTLSANEVVTPC